MLVQKKKKQTCAQIFSLEGKKEKRAQLQPFHGPPFTRPHSLRGGTGAEEEETRCLSNQRTVVLMVDPCQRSVQLLPKKEKKKPLLRMKKWRQTHSECYESWPIFNRPLPKKKREVSSAQSTQGRGRVDTDVRGKEEGLVEADVLGFNWKSRAAFKCSLWFAFASTTTRHMATNQCAKIEILRAQCSRNGRGF